MVQVFETLDYSVCESSGTRNRTAIGSPIYVQERRVDPRCAGNSKMGSGRVNWDQFEDITHPDLESLVAESAYGERPLRNAPPIPCYLNLISTNP